MLFLFLIFIILFVLLPLGVAAYRIWDYRRRMQRFMNDPAGAMADEMRRQQSKAGNRSKKKSRNIFTDFFGFGDSEEEQIRKKKIPEDVGEYVNFTEVSANDTQTTGSDGTHTEYKTEEQISDAEWEDIK